MIDYDESLEPCPICGSKAYVAHIKADGFDFGWDAGCPVFKRDDGVHGIGWDDEVRNEIWPRVECRASRDGAIAAWNVWLRKYKALHGGKDG
jgi:hypothetical protein